MNSNTLPHPAARFQSAVALALLGVAAAIIGGLGWLDRNQAVAAWLDRKSLESCRQTRSIHYHLEYHHTPEELWLFHLSEMDFSKGGVYFLGPSAVSQSTELWQLPPDLQGLIHNFGVSTANWKGELALLQFLIEKKGLLAAGGEKNLVVLGTTYLNVWFPPNSFPDSYTNALQIHGLFSCDLQHGIQEVPVNPISKFIDFEESRETGFIISLRDVLSHQISRWKHHGVEPQRVYQPELYMKYRNECMGPDWQKEIDEAMPELRQLIDYLQARHVAVRLVIMPYGSWEKKLPYEDVYTRETLAVCAEKHVAVSDWSNLLTDDEFADSTHANLYGVDKTQPALMDIALPFLRSTHALPETPPAREPSAK